MVWGDIIIMSIIKGVLYATEEPVEKSNEMMILVIAGDLSPPPIRGPSRPTQRQEKVSNTVCS